MMKVLIVDDEPLVRLGMRSIIEWERHGYTIVGEAGTGTQGLEMIRSLAPDIVLADIMMPGIDGIEMIQKAREWGYKGRFVILTCVSEFEYLQNAIRLGVSEYILKSTVKPAEILAAVEGVSQQVHKSRAMGELAGEGAGGGNYALNEFLNLVCKGIIADTADVAQKLGVFGFGAGQKTWLQLYTLRDDAAATHGRLYKIADIGTSLLMEEYAGSCFVNYEDYLVLLYQGADSGEEFSFRLRASVKQYFDTKLVYAAREIDTDRWNIRAAYEDAREELAHSYFARKGGAAKSEAGGIPSTEFSSFEKLAGTLAVVKDMMVQSSAVSEKEARGLYAGAVDYVALLFELKPEEYLPEGQNSVRRYLEGFDSFGAMYAAVLEVLRHCYELAGQKGYRQYDDELTDAMVKYVHTHCGGRITTKDVARHVHFSVDYTCKYFKKKTQTNLSDYILKLKIHKSKNDLLAGDSVSKVAEAYGFSSDGHFVKTFKRYEGITPGAYVKQQAR